MATASNPVPPIPPPTIPVFDPGTGRVTQEWYILLKALRDILAIVRSEIP